MQWVNSKFDACSNGHICPPVADTQLPPRILALERSDDGEILVKVIETRESRGKYAALSHCWGIQLPCTTTKDNLGERMRGIPWQALPKTFQDATRYCVELGIFYLWIDALCILQDDEREWQIQSSKMADIYQNSCITLAATSSDCGSAGCFMEQVFPSAECSLQVQSQSGRTYRLLIRIHLSHWSVPLTAAARRDYPLLSRGWAFQERVLSPRILHFCKDELVWECGEGMQCECGSLTETENLKRQFALATRLKIEDEIQQPAPSEQVGNESESEDDSDSGEAQCESANRQAMIGNRNAQQFQRDAQFRYTELLEIAGRAPQSNLDKAISQWHRIVEQYSALELTKDMDCLPALSGLAERMAPFLGTYRAGLWDLSLLHDLSWRVETPDLAVPQLSNYRGPSWSWVSVSTRVSFWSKVEMEPLSALVRIAQGLQDTRPPSAPLGTLSLTAQVKSCQVRVGGRNPYGAVTSAFLVLKGKLREVKPWHDSLTLSKTSIPSRFEVEVHDVQRSSVTSLRLPFFADHVMCDFGTQTTRLYLFMLQPHIGLVLTRTQERIQDAAISIYRRVGILKVPYDIEGTYHINLIAGGTKAVIAIM